MKTTFLLFLLTVSLGVARAQDAGYADYSDSSADYAAQPAIVYQSPVVYQAPVMYNAPVAYYGPVYYGLPQMAMNCALNACATACRNYNYNALSTVTYIGGGQVHYQVSPPCNYGSTLVFIGGSWFH